MEPHSAQARGRLRDFLTVRLTGHIHADIGRAVIGVFIALRVSDGVAVALALPNVTNKASSPAAFYVCTAAVVVFSAWLCTAAWRHGISRIRPWGYVDYAVTVASLVVTSALFPHSEQFGSWLVWGPGYAIGTAAGIGFWAKTPRRAVGLGIGLAIVYTVVWALDSSAGPWVIVANASNYVTIAFLASWVTGYLRAMADETERAREQAVLAQATLERERYRLAVHDATGILRLLGDDATPDEMQEALREQALSESSKLRSFLDEVPPRADVEGRQTIRSVVGAAISGFRDLPVELALDLAPDYELAAEDAAVLKDAVVTVLHNVRHHAHAAMVVIHADESGDRWEISIRDDGIGFDMSAQPLGFGLSRQVVAALADRSMTTLIESEPGHGTSVVMQGAVLAPPELRVI